MDITIPHKFVPREYQLPIFQAMDLGYKRIIQIRHRRAGKEKTDVNIVCKQMLKRVGAYFYIFPTYTQGRKILRDGMDKDGFKFLNHIPEEIRKRTNNQEMIIELKNGSILQVVGSDRIDLIVGTNPVGVVLSEYSLQNPKARDFLRPILAENEGRAMFNFTPRGENHAFDLYEFAKNDPTRYVSKMTVDDTKAIKKEVLEQERREIIAKNGDDSIFMQEYYVSFDASIQGSYYGHLIKKATEDRRITTIPYEVGIEVQTVRDLGMSDSTSIRFLQIVGKEVRLIDYYESNGEALSHYANILNQKGYNYGTHYLPHDAEVRELGTGVSRVDTFKKLGLTKIQIVPKMNILDGIEAVRQILPYCWFDEQKTKEGVSALRNYHKEYDEARKTYKSHPEHDWSSHASDAFRYLAISMNQLLKQKAQYKAFTSSTYKL